jgi:hypothetical protein
MDDSNSNNDSSTGSDEDDIDDDDDDDSSSSDNDSSSSSDDEEDEDDDDDDVDSSSSSSSSSNYSAVEISSSFYYEFMHEAHEIHNRTSHHVGSQMMETRRFRKFFGISAAVTMILWDLLVEHNLLPPKGKIKHLLWSLYFLKIYSNEEPTCAVLGGSKGAIDPKTMRHWVWAFIRAIAKLGPVVVSASTPKYLICSFAILTVMPHLLLD